MPKTKPITEVEGDIMRNFNKEFRNNDWYFRDWEQIERFISRNLATYKKEVQRETILEVLELVRDEDSWIADKIWGGYQKYLADGEEKKI